MKLGNILLLLLNLSRRQPVRCGLRDMGGSCVSES